MAKAKTTPRATADFARARSEAKLIAERDDANARAAAANVECAKSRDETQLLKKENARLTALIEEHDRVRKFLSTEKTALRLRLQSLKLQCLQRFGGQPLTALHGTPDGHTVVALQAFVQGKQQR